MENHQQGNLVLMYKQILITGFKRNVWGSVGRVNVYNRWQFIHSFITIDITSVLLLNIVSQEFLRNRKQNKMSYINHSVQRKSHVSLSWFLSGSCILVELHFGNIAFCGGRKTRESGEKPSEQVITNNKLNPYMAPGRNRTRAPWVRGECSPHQQ